MKALAALLILVATGIGGLWIAHGADLATREKVAVTVISTDDFGDEVETIEWKKPNDYPVTGFHIGLDYAAPIIGLLGGLGVALLVIDRRRRNQEST